MATLLVAVFIFLVPDKLTELCRLKIYLFQLVLNKLAVLKYQPYVSLVQGV